MTGTIILGAGSEAESVSVAGVVLRSLERKNKTAQTVAAVNKRITGKVAKRCLVLMR